MNQSQTQPPTTPTDAWAHAKYWLWKAVTVLVLSPMYCALIAEGLRTLVPALGLKIHKLPVPGTAVLGQYEKTRRMDLAIFMAIFLLVAVWWLWEQILKVFLGCDSHFQNSGWNADAYKRLVFILGFVILGADTCLFYASIAQLDWGGNKFSIPALLATAAYLAVIIFVSLVSINLRKPLDGR